jgi:hypothetical protein
VVGGTLVDTLGQTHLESNGGEGETAGGQSLMDTGESMGERGDTFVLLVAQGGPCRGVIPEGSSTGGIVEARGSRV